MDKPVCQRDFKSHDLRAHGCVLASLAYIRRWAGGTEDSEGEVAALRHDSGASLADFRKRGIMLGEAVTAQRFPYDAQRLPPRYRKVLGGTFKDDILPDLRAGAYALIWSNYAVVQDAGMGYGSFRGGHAVVYGEPNENTVGVADPLRRNIVRWDLELAAKAAERFGSKKRINALIVKPSPTYRGEYKRLLARVAQLEHDASPEALEALRGKVKDWAGRQEAMADEMDAAVAPV